jgi:sucrose-6-phosphate hydrolase SacC (GH32 family)
MGWLNNHRYAQATPTRPWRGALSAPRQLSLREDAQGLVLAQQPLPQLAARRTQRRHEAGLRLGAAPLVWDLDGNDGMRWDIDLCIAPGDAAAVDLHIGAVDGEHVLVGYRAEARSVFVDRSYSGRMTERPDFAGRRHAPVASGATLRLRILVDDCSVEVFVDDGAAVITELVFPTAPYSTLSLHAPGGSAELLSLDLWHLT